MVNIAVYFNSCDQVYKLHKCDLLTVKFDIKIVTKLPKYPRSSTIINKIFFNSLARFFFYALTSVLLILNKYVFVKNVKYTHRDMFNCTFFAFPSG